MSTRLIALFTLIFLLGCEMKQQVWQKHMLASLGKAVFTQQTMQHHLSASAWTQDDLVDSIIVLQNDSLLLPFRALSEQNFVLLHFEGQQYATFDYYFRKYANAASFSNLSAEQILPLADSLAIQQPVFIATIDESLTQSLDFFNLALTLNKLAEEHPLVIINHSATIHLSGFHRDIVLVQMPKKSQQTEALAAQALFGGTDVMGILSDSLSTELPQGAGDFIAAVRLGYAAPEQVGIDRERLEKIQTIAEKAIQIGAFPGAQVLVAKDGKIIYDKAFGHHSYEQQQAVNTNDLYDLASISKVAATTLAAMNLYENQQLSLSAPIRAYIPGRTSLYYTRIQRLLTHTSGLQPHLPIAKYIFHAKDYGADCDTFFCTRPLPPYTLKVADGLYFNEQEKDKILENCFKVRPYKRRRYRYSDLNFVLLQQIIEKQSDQDLESFVNDKFYTPLGLRRLLYNPLSKYEIQEIAPTVVDTAWRHQVLRGNVHDEGAALFGGVAGNAGLFSNAEDLAVLFQMLLNGGSYGGTQLLTPSTVTKFTSKQSKVHRGLGFDKPSGRRGNLPYAKSASASTFGHTGFTGTAVWADPEHDLIFILLTNRVHPNKYNRKLQRYDIRAQMHQAVYDALGTAKVDVK
ncbi:MAG: serine hydrolase [Bacteroidota bacterium]